MSVTIDLEHGTPYRVSGVRAPSRLPDDLLWRGLTEACKQMPAHVLVNGRWYAHTWFVACPADISLRVYLDDERVPPKGWVLVRWPAEAISLLETGRVVGLSVDHDLGDDERTGYHVLTWLEEAVATLGFVPPDEIHVHSDNAGARGRMVQAVESIRRMTQRQR